MSQYKKIENISNTSGQLAENDFEQLKSILLDEDRKESELIQSDLNEIKKILTDEEFTKLVSPIIKAHFEELKLNFPKLYGDVVRDAIAKQVKEHEDEMVQTMYPIVGKMTKKYITSEFVKFVEFMEVNRGSITGKVRVILNKIKNKIKNKLGIKTKRQSSPIYLALNKQIEEVFIIEKYTGFIIASYSEDGPFKSNQEMMVGLLTAIKSFSEDAMGKTEEVLGSIQFESYNIISVDFYNHYGAVVVNGPVTEKFKSEIEDRLLDYAEENLKGILESSTKYDEQKLSESLKKHISDE